MQKRANHQIITPSYDADQTNWFAQADSLTEAGPGNKYARHGRWADPDDPYADGFSLGMRRPAARRETAGESVDLRDMSKYDSREAKTKRNGYSFGLDARFGGMYC